MLQKLEWNPLGFVGFGVLGLGPVVSMVNLRRLKLTEGRK